MQVLNSSRKTFLLLFLLLSTLLLQSCATIPPPRNIYNICSVFWQHPKWYWAAQDTQRKWGVPISVQMAIIYQESHFVSNAKPPREHFLWVIPWFRPTSADGYAQVINETWSRYKSEVGHPFARRTKFEDALNFIGWFAYRARREAHIRSNDAYALYLAYHEGIYGYKRRTYLRKRWLRNVAWSVKKRADIYHRQLVWCARRLPRKPWYRFW